MKVNRKHNHSSEKKRFMLDEILQNLKYFWNFKAQEYFTKGKKLLQSFGIPKLCQILMINLSTADFIKHKSLISEQWTIIVIWFNQSSRQWTNLYSVKFLSKKCQCYYRRTKHGEVQKGEKEKTNDEVII